MRRAQGISGLLLGRFIVSHRYADDVVTGTQVLGVPANVLGVVAECGLKPSKNCAALPMRLAMDVDARQALLAVKYVAALGSESRPVQALAGVLEHRVIGEDPDDASAWIGERVA
jgi:hypothetical protein